MINYLIANTSSAPQGRSPKGSRLDSTLALKPARRLCRSEGSLPMCATLRDVLRVAGSTRSAASPSRDRDRLCSTAARSGRTPRAMLRVAWPPTARTHVGHGPSLAPGRPWATLDEEQTAQCQVDVAPRKRPHELDDGRDHRRQAVVQGRRQRRVPEGAWYVGQFVEASPASRRMREQRSWNATPAPVGPRAAWCGSALRLGVPLQSRQPIREGYVAGLRTIVCSWHTVSLQKDGFSTKRPFLP
jgi:hypothetical protein